MVASPEVFETLGGKWSKFRPWSTFRPSDGHRPFLLCIGYQPPLKLNNTPRIFYNDSSLPNLDDVTKEALRPMKFMVYYRPPGQHAVHVSYDLRAGTLESSLPTFAFKITVSLSMSGKDKCRINEVGHFLGAHDLLGRILTVCEHKQQLEQLFNN